MNKRQRKKQIKQIKRQLRESDVPKQVATAFLNQRSALMAWVRR